MNPDLCGGGSRTPAFRAAVRGGLAEVMQGTVLVDKPFPDEPPLEQIYNDLLIGDVEAVPKSWSARSVRPIRCTCLRPRCDRGPRRGAADGCNIRRLAADFAQVDVSVESADRRASCLVS